MTEIMNILTEMIKQEKDENIKMAPELMLIQGNAINQALKRREQMNGFITTGESN